MTLDLYVWKSPRDLDAARAEPLLKGWHEAGGDPANSPFEPSTDVGWFYRELIKDLPGLKSNVGRRAEPEHSADMAVDHAWAVRADGRAAAVAGGIGGVIAVVAWFLGIPLLSGLLMLVGGFMLAMAVYTFIHEGRRALRARRPQLRDSSMCRSGDATSQIEASARA